MPVYFADGPDRTGPVTGKRIAQVGCLAVLILVFLAAYLIMRQPPSAPAVAPAPAPKR
jgi:hypothetical protein